MFLSAMEERWVRVVPHHHPMACYTVEYAGILFSRFEVEVDGKQEKTGDHPRHGHWRGGVVETNLLGEEPRKVEFVVGGWHFLGGDGQFWRVDKR